MTLAIFDLDHTLIDGDSDYLWGEYMVASGLVDEKAYRERNEAFYQAYQRGQLDNDEYLQFALEPLTRHSLEAEIDWQAPAAIIASSKAYSAAAAPPSSLQKRERKRTDFIILFLPYTLRPAPSVEDHICPNVRILSRSYLLNKISNLRLEATAKPKLKILL